MHVTGLLSPFSNWLWVWCTSCCQSCSTVHVAVSNIGFLVVGTNTWHQWSTCIGTPAVVVLRTINLRKYISSFTRPWHRSDTSKFAQNQPGETTWSCQRKGHQTASRWCRNDNKPPRRNSWHHIAPRWHKLYTSDSQSSKTIIVVHDCCTTAARLLQILFTLQYIFVLNYVQLRSVESENNRTVVAAARLTEASILKASYSMDEYPLTAHRRNNEYYKLSVVSACRNGILLTALVGDHPVFHLSNLRSHRGVVGHSTRSPPSPQFLADMQHIPSRSHHTREHNVPFSVACSSTAQLVTYSPLLSVPGFYPTPTLQ